MNPSLGRGLGSIDGRALAASRIGVGCLMAVDAATRWFEADLLLSDVGLTPRSMVAYLWGTARASLYFLYGAPWWSQLLLAGTALTGIALALGWHTRITTVVAWILTASLHHRVPMVLDGGDNVLLLLLFWGMFLPWGARWSLDARRRSNVVTTPVRSIATAGVLLQVTSVYFFAGILKLFGASWRTGLAVSLAAGQELWARPLGLWIHSAGWLSHGLTYAVVVTEMVAPLLLWVPYRTPRWRIGGVGLLVALQVGLAVSIELWLFPWVMLAGLVLFLPSAFWDAAEARWRPRLPRESPITPAPLPRVAALGLWGVVGFTVLSNVDSVVGGIVPAPARSVGRVLGLEQGWGFYAPDPYGANFDLELTGVLAGGDTVRLDQVHPSHGRLYAGYRRKVFVEWVADTEREAGHWGLARWLCRTWPAGRSPIRVVRLDLTERPMLPAGDRGTGRYSLATVPCPDSPRGL